MDIVQKLQLIKQLSGLTQEKLAQKIGVSFPTVNSWINGKSTPRHSKQRVIDTLYFELTGEREFAKTSLLAKKSIVLRKEKKTKDVLNLIRGRADIYDQFMLSLTYHTNRIEGSTLTEPETAAILFDNVSLPNKNIIELMEVKNHQAALTFLLETLISNRKIDEKFILNLHANLMNGIQQDAGSYRGHGVRIVGSNVPTANYAKVPLLMKELIKDISAERKDIIAHVSEIHSRFEKIHPFSDGNGRIGRLLVHAMLLNQNFPPAVIRQEKKMLYIKYLNRSQLKGEFLDLEEFLCDAVLEGYDILQKSF